MQVWNHKFQWLGWAWLLPVLLRVDQDSCEDFNSVPEILQAEIFIGAVLIVVMVHNGQADPLVRNQIEKPVNLLFLSN